MSGENKVMTMRHDADSFNADSHADVFCFGLVFNCQIHMIKFYKPTNCIRQKIKLMNKNTDQKM